MIYCFHYDKPEERDKDEEFVKPQQAKNVRRRRPHNNGMICREQREQCPRFFPRRHKNNFLMFISINRHNCHVICVKNYNRQSVITLCAHKKSKKIVYIQLATTVPLIKSLATTFLLCRELVGYVCYIQKGHGLFTMHGTKRGKAHI